MRTFALVAAERILTRSEGEMRKAGPFVVALAIAVAVGCAADKGNAQDTKPTKQGENDAPKEAPKATPSPGAKAGEEKRPEHHFKAKVEDHHGTTVGVHDLIVWVPDASLFGGSSGEPQRFLVVKHGPADITVPFEEIASIDLGTEKEDRLDVAIKFKDPEKAGKELRGTIRSSLELRGTFEGSKLQLKIKIHEVKSIVIEEIPSAG